MPIESDNPETSDQANPWQPPIDADTLPNRSASPLTSQVKYVFVLLGFFAIYVAAVLYQRSLIDQPGTNPRSFAIPVILLGYGTGLVFALGCAINTVWQVCRWRLLAAVASAGIGIAILFLVNWGIHYSRVLYMT